MGTERVGGSLPLLAAVLLFLALAAFGARYHWVEEAGTAERDGYVAQAEEILHGTLPHDPFRPPLYALATAGLAKIVGDPFTAARLLSNLAAAALAFLAWATGRRLGGPTAGAWAMALLAVNPNLWILGQHVATDMVFAALGAAALYAGLCYLERPGPGSALGAGTAFGLAAFTRSNAVFLLPALLAAGAGTGAGAGSWPGWRRRLRDLGLAVGAAVLVLLPHWALRQAAFGNPFYDENWKNLAWKLYGYPDWSYLDRVPFRGLLEIVRGNPAAVVRGGVAELARFASGGVAQLLGTWAQVLLVAAGAAWALRERSRRRPAAWLLFAAGTFLAAAAFSFFTWGRLLLLLVPACYALGFAPWGSARDRQSRLALAGVAAGLVALLAVKTFGYRLPAFVAHHPYGEVAALQRLEATALPPGAGAAQPGFAGTSPFLGRYLHHPYLYVPDAFGREIAEPDLYYARLRALLRDAKVAYLVVGENDLRDRPRGLLGDAGAPVDWLEAVPGAGGRGVAVWRVRRLRPRWGP